MRGTFLAIKHFLRHIKDYQEEEKAELDSPAIVVAETGIIGGLDGNSSLHHSLVNKVMNEILRINHRGRINVISSAITAADTEQSNGAPAAVARTMAFLASGRAAGQISGQYIRVGGNKGPRPDDSKNIKDMATRDPEHSIPRALAAPKRNKIRVAVSVDLDAVSGWLGTSVTC